MPKNEKCVAHDRELKEIRTEFGDFKKNNNIFKTEITKKIDDLMIEAKKPLLNDKTIISIIIGLAVYLVIAVSYVNANNSRSLKNEEDITDYKKDKDKMMDLLLGIKEDVGIIKGKSDSKNNTNE